KSDDLEDAFLKDSAVVTLGEIGEAAAEAIPDLNRIASEPGDDISDWNLSDLAEDAIRKIRQASAK
ncbi:MAG: hypothetical protein KDA84_11785, partial [Planctomycetaceae bacterium]|nr:hypothetical protein [Planctomycetaceae bacterium]